jgi:hypothetical protein
MKILAALLLGLLCSSLGLLADAGMEAFYDHTPEVERPGFVLVLDAFTPVTWWSSWMVGALVALTWGASRHNVSNGYHLAVAIIALQLSIVSLIALPSVLRFLTYMNGPRDVPSYRIGVNVLIFIGLSIASYRSMVTKSAEQAGSSNGG